MASIHRLTVQGIRSFGPDDNDTSVISFFKPLTLILGQNGSGKTTIIECLNYATTGELPPLAKKDGSFVHDPKIARETTVHAKVGLFITDCKGVRKKIHRGMEATQKGPDKVTTSTLNCTVTKMNPDGSTSSIDTKCADLNVEMISSLGVNKAVLTNVIFCHQEDSNWPLSEGTVLKNKFDEIFNAVKYTKVLDALRTIRKEKINEIKVHQAEIRHLKLHKERAASILEDQRRTQTKLADCQAAIREKNEQLQPQQQALEEIVQRAHEIFTIDKKIAAVNEAINQIQKNKEDLRKNIKNEYMGSMEDLEIDIRDYNRKIEEQRRNLKLLEEKLCNIKDDCERIHRNTTEKFAEKGKLETDLQNHEAAKQRRDELIQSLTAQHQLEGFSLRTATDTSSHINRFYALLAEKRKSCEADMAKLKRDFEEEEAQLQKVIEQHRDSKSRVEQTLKVKDDMLSHSHAEIRNINRELSEINAPSGRLEEIDRLLKEAMRRQSEEERRVDVAALQLEIENKDAEKKEVDKKLRIVNDEISKVSMESEERAELKRNHSDKSEKEEQVRRIMNRQEESLVHLLGSVPVTGLADMVSECNRNRERNIRSLQSKTQQARIELSSLETKRKSDKLLYDEKEKAIREFDDEVYTTFGSQDFDFNTDDTQRNINDLQKDKGQLDAMSVMYDKWITELEKNEPSCPTCERKFDTHKEVAGLIRLLQRKKNLLPQKLQEKAEQLRKKTDEYRRIIELRPRRVQITRMKDEDMPKLSNSLRDIANKTEKLKQTLEEDEELLYQEQSDMNMGQHMIADLTMVDQYYSEVKELQRRITMQEAKLSTNEQTKSSEELKNEKDELELQVDVLSRMLDQKRKKEQSHHKLVNELQNQAIMYEKEKLEISKGLDKRKQLEVKKAELVSSGQTLDMEIKEAKAKIRPLETQIHEAEAKKKDKIRVKEEALSQSHAAVISLQDDEQKVKRLNDDVQSFLSKGGHDFLRKSKEEIKALEEELRNKSVQRTSTENKIQDMRHQISSHEVNERELRDNQSLREFDRQIEKKNSDVAMYRQRIAKYDVDNLQRQKERYETDIANLKQEIDIKKGSKISLLEHLDKLEADLSLDEHRDADKKHMNKLIQLKVEELSHHDVEKYYKALDNAVMTYHQNKMKEINKIIRNLWKTIYQGTDIDYIEIRTEGGTGNMSRRQFKYRVVMVKGDTVLDMRGRCSAGQKVIASIIIRLALSESFCGSCGILTLDEPTTNLDHDNIASLSRALAELVRSRSEQQNFQLVVITHDEDFVASFSNTGCVNQYYRVSKNPHTGCSKIDRCRIQDIADH